MSDNHDDELIKIKKREKKRIQRENKRKKAPRVRSAPHANGVRLDFTEEAPKVNRYWLGISKRYRACKIISVFLLCAFLLVMLVFYRENITYANLVYLVRDLDSDGVVEVGGYSDIKHERSQDCDYGLFRSRIAIASPKGFSLYSATGSLDLESPDVLAEPRLEVSDKYALVYGAGEKKYSVYTTVARVLSAESEFEIEDAALSDSGSFALLTRSRESRFLITVYDDSFKERAYYYKDNFVTDIALDAKGENIAAVCAKIEGAETTAVVMLGKIGVKESASFEYKGMMPLSCEYTEDGRCIVLCDSALLIFENEKEIANISFEGLTPGYFDISRNTVAISFATNVVGSENTLRIFDTAGDELCSAEISGKISAVAADGSQAVYAVTDKEAFKIFVKDEKKISVECDLQVIYAMAPPGSLIVCTPEGTTSLFTD